MEVQDRRTDKDRIIGQYQEEGIGGGVWLKR